MVKKIPKKKKHPVARKPKEGSPSRAAGLFSPFDRLSAFQKNLLAIFFIYILLIVLFREFIFGGFVLSSPDMLNNSLILRQWGSEYIRTEHAMPFWYPYMFSGMPSLGSLLYSPFYPIEFVHNMLHGVLDFFLPMFMVRHLLCGILAYILLRGLSLARISSLAGSLIFSFPPYLIALTMAGHGGKLSTASYLPLLLLAVIRLFRERTFLNVVLMSSTIGLMLLAQHPQISYYGFLMVGIYVVYRLITGLILKERASGLALSVILLALSIAIGLGLSSVFYLPIMEYTPYSMRGGYETGSQYDFATSWSFHPKEIATFFIPSYYGFGGQTYWGEMPFTDYPNYLGVVAIILALIGFAFSRKRIRYFFFSLGLFALFISFGRHFSTVYDLLYHHLPYFSSFRVPVLILILLILSVASLAGMGMESMGSILCDRPGETGEGERKRLRFYLAGMGICFAVIALGTVGLQKATTGGIEAHFSALKVPPEALSHMVTLCLRLMVRDAVKMTALAGVTLTAIYLCMRKVFGFHTLKLFLLVLLVVDVFAVDSRLRFQKSSPEMIEEYFAADDAVRFLKSDQDHFRILPLGNATNSNWYGYHGIASIGGYNPAKIKTYDEIIQRLTLANQNVINMLNTKYLVSTVKIEHPNFSPVFEGKSKRVYLNRNFIERAILVSEVRTIEDSPELIRILGSREFDPSRQALLAEAPPYTITPGECGTVEITSLKSHHISARAEVKIPCLLVLSEVYYPPGWRCVVDGRKQKIYRANYILRSTFLQPGSHTVEFIFDPGSYRKGKALSLVSLALVVLFGFLHFAARRRSRRSGNVEKHGGDTDIQRA